MKRFYSFFIFTLLVSANLFADHQDTPFYNAIDNNSYGLIESLIASGEDVNMQDQSGKTPLMYACQKSSPDIVKFLIEKGANVNIKTYNNVTALHYASRNKNIEVVKLLIQNNANLNAQDFSGFTPLMRAISNGNYPNFKALLIAGSNPFILNKNSKDSVDLVIKSSNDKMFNLFVSPLTSANRNELIAFKLKLEEAGNKGFWKIYNAKSLDITDDTLRLIADFSNDTKEVESASFSKSLNLADFPCYEVISAEVGSNSCITVSDELEDRVRKQNTKNEEAIIIEQNTKSESTKPLVNNDVIADIAIIPLGAISRVEAPINNLITLPLDKDGNKDLPTSDINAGNNIAAEAAVVPVVESVAEPLTEPEIVPVTKLQEGIIPISAVEADSNMVANRKEVAEAGLYEDFIKENNLSIDDITKDFVEIDFLSTLKWLYVEEPTDIIEYGVLASYYEEGVDPQASFHMNVEYLKEQKLKGKKARLLLVEPRVKQSDKMKHPGYYIQSGSFIYSKNSSSLKKDLGKYGNVFIVEKLVRKRNFHVVYVGPFKTKKEALRISREKGFQKIIGVESFIRNF
ncbi:MAG: hypothetical protein HOM96_04270 [Rickettsiales bacterium]|nr:hypothetical protein [Rickettsiales bacterium]